MPSIGTKQNNHLICPAWALPLPFANFPIPSVFGSLRSQGEKESEQEEIGSSKEHVPLCPVLTSSAFGGSSF